MKILLTKNNLIIQKLTSSMCLNVIIDKMGKSHYLTDALQSGLHEQIMQRARIMGSLITMRIIES